MRPETSKGGESAQLAIWASVSSPACANEQRQILSSGMFFDCNVNVIINKKEFKNGKVISIVVT